MIINVTYDPSVNSAPSTFKSAVNAVVAYYESTFTNPVTINIEVGYGTTPANTPGGPTLLNSTTNPTTGGENHAPGFSFSYTEVLQALSKDAQSATQKTAYATLPANSPDNGTLFLTYAQAQALGLAPATGIPIGISSTDRTVPNSSVVFDGYVGVNSSISTYNVLISTLEHEFSEVMGRTSSLAASAPSYTVMDLFRYANPSTSPSSGTRDTNKMPPGASTGPTSVAYFSVNNGATDLATWNNYAKYGDLGDLVNGAPSGTAASWASDPFGTGAVTTLPPVDIELMNVLGWNTAAGPLTVKGVVASAPGGAGAIGSGLVELPGQKITFTLTMSEPVKVTGTPMLSLSDNGVATYDPVHSTSTSLAFNYVVGASNTDSAALAVIGVNLNGGNITDAAGNAANLAGAYITSNFQIWTDTQDKWNVKNGNFVASSNWIAGGVPGPTNDALIPGINTPYTVTSAASQTVTSVITGPLATLDITGGTFTAIFGTGPDPVALTQVPNGTGNGGLIKVES
jgi:hypothetical protein